MDIQSIIKKNRVIILVILFCVVGRLVVSPYPFDEKIMRGGDASTHVHVIQMIKTYGLIGWDRFWSGGEPFMKFYPPMAYIISSIFPFSEVICFKLIFVLFFIFAPISFYLFAKELSLSKKEILISTIVFSFIMNFNYLFDMGTFPSMVALPFGFLFFKYFIKSLKEDNLKYAAVSSIFLGLTLVTHNIISVMFGLFALTYFAASYYTKSAKFKTKNLLIILLLGGLISSFWLLPFLIENGNSSSGWEKFDTSGDGWFVITAFTAVYRLFGFYANGLSTIITGLVVLLAFVSFISVLKNKDTDSRFLVWSLIIISVGYTLLSFSGSIMPLDRFVIFFSIPLPILISKNINFKRLKNVLLIFMIIQIAYFLMVPIQPSDKYIKYSAAFSFMNDSGRIAFHPEINSPILFMAPKLGFENDNGQYEFSVPENHSKFLQNKTLFECIGKKSVLDRMFSFDGVFSRKSLVFYRPCELVNNNYLEYFRLQNVRYIIADETVSGVFKQNPALIEVKDFGNFSLYEFSDAKYIEASIESSYSWVDSQAIKIDFRTNESRQNVRVRISETWYPHWTVNDTTIKLESDVNGFMAFSIPEIAITKSILLKYREPDYYIYFWLLSAVGLIVSFVVFKNRLT